MSHGANAVVPAPSAPTWKNWSGNLVHSPSDGVKYYFMPANLAELKSVLVEAKTRGVKVRVTGQRHSQPPLVIGNNNKGQNNNKDNNKGSGPIVFGTPLACL